MWKCPAQNRQVRNEVLGSGSINTKKKCLFDHGEFTSALRPACTWLLQLVLGRKCSTVFSTMEYHNLISTMRVMLFWDRKHREHF